MTYLSGRYVEIKMFPLSFGEFKNFRGLSDEANAFNEYMRLAPFYQIRDNYRKVLISADGIDLSVDGIEHVNLYDFLSEIK